MNTIVNLIKTWDLKEVVMQHSLSIVRMMNKHTSFSNVKISAGGKTICCKWLTPCVILYDDQNGVKMSWKSEYGNWDQYFIRFDVEKKPGAVAIQQPGLNWC